MSNAPSAGSTPTATICIVTGSRISAFNCSPGGAKRNPGTVSNAANSVPGLRFAPSGLLAPSYLPNSRSTSQPSSPAAASGRADGLGGGAEVRAGAGRYEPADGTGADGCGAALTCDAVWNRFDMKPPRCEFGKPATATP